MRIAWWWTDHWLVGSDKWKWHAVSLLFFLPNTFTCLATNEWNHWDVNKHRKSASSNNLPKLFITWELRLNVDYILVSHSSFLLLVRNFKYMLFKHKALYYLFDTQLSVFSIQDMNKDVCSLDFKDCYHIPYKWPLIE